MRLIHALRLTLALVVMLTSVHTAVGRSEARGAVDMVICAGGGTAVILLDADGDPVVHTHTCPDCLLSGLATETGVPPGVAAPKRRAARLRRPVPAGPRARRRLMRARSRGPPLRA